MKFASSNCVNWASLRQKGAIVFRTAASTTPSGRHFVIDRCTDHFLTCHSFVHSQSEASSSPVGAVVVAASAAGGGAAGGVPGRSDVNSSTANSRIAPYSWPSEASEITSSPAFWSGQSISAVNCISQHPIRSPAAAAAAAAVSAVPFKVKPVSSLHQMKPYARPIHHT